MAESGVGPSAQVVPVPTTDWPTDLLYVHLMSKLEDFKAHMGDLRTADTTAALAALAAAKEALTAALEAADKANTKSEADVERWRQANNEWRATLTEREVKFLLIDTFNAQMTGINQAITELRSFRDISLSLHPRLDALDKQVDEINDWKNKQLGRMQAQTLIAIGLFALITFAARFLGS
jgi:hypothetical protein